MKKIILTLGLIIVFLFTSCGNAENNSGPFVVEYENGIARMYSGNKLANGWLSRTRTTENERVPISKIEYKNGLPTGNMILYDKDGYEYIKSKVNEKIGEDFKATAEIEYNLGLLYGAHDEQHNYSMKVAGLIEFNTNSIIQYDPEDEYKKTFEFSLLKGNRIKYQDGKTKILEYYPGTQEYIIYFYNTLGDLDFSLNYYAEEAPEGFTPWHSHWVTYDKEKNIVDITMFENGRIIDWNKPILNKYRLEDILLKEMEAKYFVPSYYYE